MAASTKKKRKEDAYPWKDSTSSGHITNFKQSILETFDIYESNPLFRYPWIWLSGKVRYKQKDPGFDPQPFPKNNLKKALIINFQLFWTLTSESANWQLPSYSLVSCYTGLEALFRGEDTIRQAIGLDWECPSRCQCYKTF